MIKLIASDIDGTLVGDGAHQLNPEYFDVILKLRAKGIQFVAASGREWASIETIFDPVKEKIFYLSNNGAYLGCHGRNLFLSPMDREMAMEVIREARKIPHTDVMVSCPDMVYVDTDNQQFIDWIIDGYKFRVKRVEDVTCVPDEIIKISVYKANGVQEATKGLIERFGTQLKMAAAGEMWMDTMAPGVCKGQAIQVLQENLDIRPEETMAFGDQMNDIEMLNRAYYSFAVGNAREEVKRAARFQADTNTNHGVLKILKQLL